LLVLCRPVDRVVLTALSRALARRSWASFAVRPETLMRWHRRLVARRWTYSTRRPGRPALDDELVALIVRLARENPRWGYQRIAGELVGLGFRVSATSVRRVLDRNGVFPTPRRSGPSWRQFLRQQAHSMIACDFLCVDTVALKRIYVLFFIELHSRRVHLAGCTAHPDGRWVAQQARNLIMTLDQQRGPTRFVIHDRDAKFSAAFDAVFETEGARVIRTPMRAPNANAHAERFAGTLRCECLDWLLIFSRRQLERTLRIYIDHYNHHRPHRSLQLRPPDPPAPRCAPSGPAIHRRDRLAGLLHEYELAA
jgi:putative transposase